MMIPFKDCQPRRIPTMTRGRVAIEPNSVYVKKQKTDRKSKSFNKKDYKLDSGKHGNAVFPLVLQSACLNKTGYDDSSYSVVSEKKLLTNFSEKELVTCMLPNGEKGSISGH